MIIKCIGWKLIGQDKGGVIRIFAEFSLRRRFAFLLLFRIFIIFRLLLFWRNT